MKTEHNDGGITIASVAGTALRLLGVDGGLEPGAAPPDPRVLAAAPAGRVKKMLVYAPDAIGRVMAGKLSGPFHELDADGFLKFPLRSVVPSVTPVCFASMFSGLQPEGHGIRKYEKPALACKTLFDALPAAGLRAAISAVKDSSVDLIFRGRKADYFSEPDDRAVTARALALIAAGAHDFLLVYHQEYDDLLHAGDPWGAAAKEAAARHVRAFQELTAAFDAKWGGVPRAALFAPDHGAHRDRATGKGTHGEDIPEDMELFHLWKFKPGAFGGSDQDHLNRAVWLLTDRFCRFGGGARYDGMKLCDIHAYAAAWLLKRQAPALDLSQFVDSRFEEAAGECLPEAKDCLAEVKAEGAALAALLFEFARWAEEPARKLGRTGRLERLLAHLRRLNAPPRP